MRKCYRLLFPGFFSLLLFINTAHADTVSYKIDCLRVSNRLEKLVCSDPALENEDKQLDTAYLDAVDEASKSERPILIQEQERFLPLRQQCITSSMSSPTPLPTDSEKKCLIDLYEKRFSQLKSWPKDEAQVVRAHTSSQVLSIRLYFNRSDYTYTAETELLDAREKELNSGSFVGCVNNNNIIMDLANYLQNAGTLKFISLPKGFVIYNQYGCTSSPLWQLQVITPKCFALAPSNDDSGKPIYIGNDPHRLYFAYIVDHQTIPSYLDIDDEGTISYHLPDDLKAKNVSPLPKIECQ